MKRHPAPRHGLIVQANASIVARRGLTPEEAEHVCWACRLDCKAKLTRAHVLAHTHGGSNEPANFFLLCDTCHDDQPDGLPRAAQERWLFARPHWPVRLHARVVEVFEAQDRIAAEHGDPGAGARWRATVGNERARAIGAVPPASAGWRNGRATYIWALVEDFVAWLEEQERAA